MTAVVMLVEDEVIVALDVQGTIEEAGWAVDGPYGTLAEALAAIAERLPDCAVLDVRLPDGEVFGAADLLKHAGVPLIFHSGHADASSLGARYPGAFVCGKPCSPALLREEIRSALGMEPHTLPSPSMGEGPG